MSRVAHVGVAVGIGLFCCAWCVVGQVLWMSAAVGGASASNVSFILGAVVWVGVLLGSLRAAFLSLKKALRAPPRTTSPKAAASASTFEAQQTLATPDDKLAHLVKTPKDETP